MSEVISQNQNERIRQLGLFMDQYLVSSDRLQLYKNNEELIKSIRPSDLFLMPMYRDETPFSVDEIKAFAGKFVNVFYHGLVQYQWNKNASPLLADLIQENQAILSQLNAIKPYLENHVIKDSKTKLIAFYESMIAIEKKFIKLQNILYPVLENLMPSKMPFKVLWRVEDDLLELRIHILNLLQAPDVDWMKTKIAIGEFYYALTGLIQKEELIVFPMASDRIDASVWDDMIDAAYGIGFAFLELPKPKRVHTKSVMSDFLIQTATGSLSLSQFDLLMSHLPVSITFVDEFDKVVYFNQTKEPHFPRTPQVIGREVRYCHPQKSVHVVEKILTEFKNGRRDEAVFWMSMGPKKLLITYYALRDDHQQYKGVMEVTQDISKMSEYSGEKRLLDWK